MLLGYEPEPLKPGPAKPPPGKFQNQSNTVPSYFAGASRSGRGERFAGARALTHTVQSPFFTGPLRSPLRIQNTFANECFMDELCARAKADPVAFRLRHLSNARVIGVIQGGCEGGGLGTLARHTAQVEKRRSARTRDRVCRITRAGTAMRRSSPKSG